MKVLQFTIPVPGDHNIIVRRDLLPYFYPHLHRHDEVQLTWIQKGEGTLVVDNNMHPFASNQIYLIGANQPHVFKSDPVYFSPKPLRKVQALTIHFDPRGKMKSLFDLDEMETLRAFLHKLDKGFSIPEAHVPDVSQKMQAVARTTGVEQLIAFIDLLRKFRNTPDLKELSSVSCLNTVSEHDGIRLSHIYNFVMVNYAKQITLDDVAKEAHMSPQAFCRYFKKRTLNTFVTFLNEVRVNEACKKLITEDFESTSISAVAYNCGFNTITNFNRVFKSVIGKSPTEYLENYFRSTYEEPVLSEN